MAPVEVDLNIVSPEEEQILQKTMHRLAERVRRAEGEVEGRRRWVDGGKSGGGDGWMVGRVEKRGGGRKEEKRILEIR